jgi:NAD(P)-dependent dehydrogenase (short-subunit alcohol dehydrogenase family)
VRVTAPAATAYETSRNQDTMPDTTQSQARAALITGASRRIGRTIALTLARAGYALALHANRSRDDAERLAAEIGAAGGHAAVVLGDLADAQAVRGIVPAAAAAVGPLALLVNNASEFAEDGIATLDRARFDHTMAVNLAAPLFLTQAFAAQAGEGASIVNVLDQRVLKPTPRFLSYTLSKSALYTATTTLAQALAPRVRVNGVAPGPTLPSARQTDAQFAAQAAALPLGSGPAPEDIAAAVLYLAEARSVTGVTMAVDGGQHLSWRTADSDLAE